MAKAVIYEKKNRLQSLKAISYAILKIKTNKRKTTVTEVLPFRVKFINIGIESYGPSNVPPIGIAVIGISNYIL